MDELKEIIKKLLKEIEEKENILNVKGAKGGGTGTARVSNPHPVSKNLGDEKNETEQKDYELKPVKISKVFTRKNK